MSHENNDEETGALNMSKRDFLRTGATVGTAATLGTTAGVNVMSEPADAFVPTLTAQVISAKAATEILGGSLDLLGSYGFEFGSDNEQAKEKWSRMYTQAKEIGAKDSIVNTVINNSYDRFRNPYFAKGKQAAINSMNAGDSKSTVKNKAVDAGDVEAARTQENLLKYLDVRNQELLRFSQAAEYIKNNYTEDRVDSLFAITLSDGPDGSFSKNYGKLVSESGLEDNIITLFDGRSYTLSGFNKDVQDFPTITLDTKLSDRTLTENTNLGTIPTIDDPYGVGRFETSDRDEFIDRIYVYNLPDSDDDGSVLLYNISLWHRAYWQLGVYRNDAANALRSFIDGIYDSYTAGDITETELLNAYDLSDISRDGEYSAGTVSLAKLGIATDSGSEVRIKLDDGQEFVGTLFIDVSSETTLKTGNIYSPSEFTGSVYITYVPENEDGAGVRKIEQKFELIEATKDGSNVDSVTFTDSSVKLDDTDTQELKDELSKLRDRNEKLQKQVDSVTAGSGDGGGLLDAAGETDPLLLVAGAVGGLALLNTLLD